MKELVIGIVSSILGSVLTCIAVKMYFGFNHFNGVRNLARLNKDCLSGGIINVFPNRKAYAQHKDHGTSSEYMMKTEHTFLYVGYWLASITEMGNIKDTIRRLVNDQKTVTLVFLNPGNASALQTCTQYTGISVDAMKFRINDALKELLKLKDSIGENSQYFHIKVHDIPLSTTAFVMDYTNPEKCRVLLDYKIYGCSREKSYGIEFQNRQKVLTSEIAKSYMDIANNSKELKVFQDLFLAYC